MTGGPALSVTKGEGRAAIREARLSGRGPFHGLGQNGTPPPFSIFFIKTLFLFYFILKLLQINPKLIQTNFEFCKKFPLLS
jgi:hypothetical protein